MPRDPQQTRRQLLAAAAQQFQTEGFFGTDTNRIARQAGYAPQTFYRHFEDKRAAFLEVYAQWSATLLQAIGNAIHGALNATDEAEAIGRAIVDHHRAWAPFRASLVALSSTDEVVRTTRWAERRRQLKVFRSRTRASDAVLLQLMWTVERVADGIATGEAAAMRVSERRLVAEVTAQIGAVLEAET